jgi:uncharacterized membrane protein
MAFCGNCGTQVLEGVKFCPACGTAIGAQPTQPQQPAQQTQAAYQQPQPTNLDKQQPYQQSAQPVYQQQPGQGYQQPQQGYQQPQQGYQQLPQQPIYIPPVVPGAPTQTNIQDAQDNKVMAILAYLLFFIPLLTGAHKTSPFVKYHTNQGTVLFIAMVAWGIIYAIVTAIFTAILLGTGAWRLWSVVSMILGLLWFVPAVFCVVGIVNAVQGQMKPLPVIGKISIIK